MLVVKSRLSVIKIVEFVVCLNISLFQYLSVPAGSGEECLGDSEEVVTE